jgi:hypothetical protein
MEISGGVVSLFTRIEASGDASLRMLRKEHMVRSAFQVDQTQAEIAAHNQPKQIEACHHGERTADSG